MREIIVDSFAGGGGTSEGIKQALVYDPDIAINHDRLALAMHRVNHPGTRHMVEDVWEVDARGMCDGAPIGLLWLSPDCKHFSKAKGGKPREKDIRGLAWVALRWVKSLPKAQRPRIIALENVEEFQEWGPLLEDGRPCPVQKGATFKSFIGAFRSLGYKAEWRELRACDYGDPTIRKRLFVIMRRDRSPIVWPERTHGNPKDAKDAALIAAGKLLPWRTAAEIINWSLPCPSIFETSAEIKEKLGLRAVRPLRPNTLSRVAKGTMRYVVNAAQPFIVPVTHAGALAPFVTYGQQGGGNRDIADPLHTITASAKDQNAIVTPFVTRFNTGAVGHPVDQPLATVTSHASETHGGGAAPLGLVAPILVGCGGRAAQSEPRPADEPVLTQTSKADACVVSPFLVPRYGERPGQEPRTRAVDEPAASIVPTGNEGSLAAVHLSTMRNSQKPYSSPDEPTQTMTAGGANAALVAAFLAQHTAGSHPGQPAKPADEPVSTITGKGCQQSVVKVDLAGAPHAERTGYGDEGHRDGNPEGHADRRDMEGSRGPRLGAPEDHTSPGRVPAEKRVSRRRREDERPAVSGPGTPRSLDQAARPNPAEDGHQSSGRDESEQRSDQSRDRDQIAEPSARLPDGAEGAVEDHAEGHSGGNTVASHSASGEGQDLRADSGRSGLLADERLSRCERVAAFLSKYYGAGEPSQAADDPLHTVTAKPRHGLVTVTLMGEPYVITDIGMRMLTPRERFSAQGFRPTYIIDHGVTEDGALVRFTLEQQGRFCGNSVCPGMARSLVAANFTPLEVEMPEGRPMPLMAAE